jgi:hypothetical protein
MKLETDEALKIHIEGLQATLTKRNARILELETKLATPIELAPELQKKIDKAYARGWKDASQRFVQLARVAQTLGSNVGIEIETRKTI